MKNGTLSWCLASILRKGKPDKNIINFPKGYPEGSSDSKGLQLEFECYRETNMI